MPNISAMMIHRTGIPYGQNGGLASFSAFPSNNVALRGAGGLNSNPMAQFTSQRLPGPFSNNIGGFSLNSSLGLLSDMADVKKRVASDGFRNSIDANKRQRLSSPTVQKESPILMQRLSSMSGGFPMPKWGGVKNKKLQSNQRTDEGAAAEEAKKVLARHGAFPMPPLSDGGSRKQSDLSLRSYRELWKDTDVDLREEVLARKLERSSLGISQRKPTTSSF